MSAHASQIQAKQARTSSTPPAVSAQVAHQTCLDDVDLLKLLAAGVHDLEILVQVGLSGQGGPHEL